MNRILSLAKRPVFPAFALLLVVGSSACNQQPQQPAATSTPSAGQIVAKVGNEDVTIHELQNEYRRAGITSDKVTDAVTRAGLEEITRRKFLAQKAKTAGLDREPTVLLDILRSREQVLASALLQRDIQARFAGIGRSDLDRYINANPERFSRRVRFDVDQMTLNTPNIRQEFLDAIKDATNLDMIEAKAVEWRVPYSRGAGALYSGELPPELLERLRARKDSDVFFVRSGNTSAVFKVRGEAVDPLEGEGAQQRAQMMMRNETAQSELNRKTDEIQITYFGEYAKLMEKPASAPGPATAEGQASSGGTEANPEPPKK